jgi:hypothetical protein
MSGSMPIPGLAGSHEIYASYNIITGTTSSVNTHTTSTTSLTITGGTQILTVVLGVNFSGGMGLIIEYDTINYMSGAVTSYNPTTGELVVNITFTVGSGTYNNWIVYLYWGLNDGDTLPNVIIPIGDDAVGEFTMLEVDTSILISIDVVPSEIKQALIQSGVRFS